MPGVEAELTGLLASWFEEETRQLEGGSDRYVVCAGIAVIESLKKSFPILETDYITKGNQVKTSGALIRRILHQFREERSYVAEGGRTTRGTVPSARRLVSRLNAVSRLASVPPETRTDYAVELQRWLFDNGVAPFFRKQRLEVEIDPDQPGCLIVSSILRAAFSRNSAGAVAQHLVGAKLSLRYPHLKIENHSFTTADRPLGRSGDFLVHDTVFHVTVAPAQGVIEKCAANLRNGFRVRLLVSENKLEAARQLAEIGGVREKIGIGSLEQFIGQNMEELGEFSKTDILSNLRCLLIAYNQRVGVSETDHSLLIEIPGNL